jgi:hypothetical protein
VEERIVEERITVAGHGLLEIFRQESLEAVRVLRRRRRQRVRCNVWIAIPQRMRQTRRRASCGDAAASASGATSGSPSRSACARRWATGGSADARARMPSRVSLSRVGSISV